MPLLPCASDAATPDGLDVVITSASRPVTGSGGVPSTRRVTVAAPRVAPSTRRVTVAAPRVAPSIRHYLPRVLAAGATAVVLTYLAVTSWPSVVASLGALTHLRAGWVAPLVAAQLVSMAAPALVHHRLLRVQGSPVGIPALLGITYASNAISVTLPLAGPEVATAYTFQQLVRRGADGAVAGWTLLVSGVAAGLTAALIVLVGATAAGSTTVAALAVGSSLVLTAAAVIGLRFLRRPVTAARVEGAALRLVHRARRVQTVDVEPVGGVLRRLAAHRLGYRDAATVGALALTNWVADVLCLAAAIAAVGSGVPWTGLLLAFVAGTGVSGLRLTPGGIGVVEAAMATGLVAAGMDAPHAIAAVLLYRLVAFWLVLAAGWVAFFHARRTDRPRTDRPRTDRPRTDVPRIDVARIDRPRIDVPRIDGRRRGAPAPAGLDLSPHTAATSGQDRT